MKVKLELSTYYPRELVCTQQEITRQAILKSYRGLYQIGMCQPTSEGVDFLKLLQKAFRFVLQVYPERSHDPKAVTLFYPIDIATITAEKFKLGAKSIVCALLHGILRDKKASELTLRQEFGEEITSIIKGLTKASGTTYKDSGYGTSNLKHVVSRFSPNNLLVVLIKFAEYLHQMYAVGQLTRDKQLKLAEETHRVFIPLAHNLGLNNVYLQLEDLYLKFKYRAVYDSIVKKVRASKASREGFLESFAKQVYRALQADGVSCAIKGRTKSIASISSKIKDRKVAFDDIHDFYAIRIIFDCKIEEEYTKCWAVYETLARMYRLKVSLLRDWVSHPKNGGYEALHMTIHSHEGQLVEIQIRTKRMDDKAEYGDAAHWKYKCNSLGKEFDKMGERWLVRARNYLIRNDRDYQDNDISISVNQVYVEG